MGMPILAIAADAGWQRRKELDQGQRTLGARRPPSSFVINAAWHNRRWIPRALLSSPFPARSDHRWAMCRSNKLLPARSSRCHGLPWSPMSILCVLRKAPAPCRGHCDGIGKSNCCDFLLAISRCCTAAQCLVAARSPTHALRPPDPRTIRFPTDSNE